MASFLDVENSSKSINEILDDLVCKICRNPARPRKKVWYRCMSLHPICEKCVKKREVSFGEDFESASEDFQCPVCLMVPKPPIYQCTNGHFHCKDCHPKLKDCPVCRVYIIGRDIRALFVEQMIEKTMSRGLCSCGQPISNENCPMIKKLLTIRGLKFRCCHTKNGCKAVLEEYELEDHQSGCVFRLVPCLENAFFSKCERRVTLQDMLKHFEEAHAKSTFRSGLREIPLEQKLKSSSLEIMFQPFQLSYKVVFDNHTFVLAGKGRENVVYFWVYILESPNVAKNFSYTFKLYGSDDFTLLSFEGKVSAIDETFAMLISEAGRCFAMPTDIFLTNFKNVRRGFTFSLAIRNLMERDEDTEAEDDEEFEDQDKNYHRMLKEMVKSS